MSDTESIAGLYLIAASATPATAAVLAAALEAAPIATLLLPPAGASALAPLVELAQSRSVAALVADDARLARTLGADGVHLGWSPDLAERYAAARAALGRDAIVGIDAGGSRHDAMVLGEAGADYIAFSRPPDAANDDEQAEAQAALIAWWSELFEVPCVAFGVSDAGEVPDLVADGADFIALSLPSDRAASEVAALVRACAAAALAEPEAGRAAG